MNSANKVKVVATIGALISILGTATSSLIFALPASAGCGLLGLEPCPPKAIPWSQWAIETNNWIVQRSVIDPIYYTDRYDDLRKAFNYDPSALKKHWIENGIKECRASSPVFDVSYYLNSYPDLQAAFGQKNCSKAVRHWGENGIREGRQGHPDFSPKCYLNRYPDLQTALGASNYSAAIDHYFKYGRNEKRNGKCD
ncbi:hypothetical protein [Chamaesiphon sp. VAR_48_metabat_135_sub]|uniref:hypothetical protein n=1 Tax=Chamaesiphon sp. VAR_48_metabat_135_sub TaxID=2964699 RepID=UPI00286D3A7C|nr:hypothetical protein [Chamaesiphon sp. VAR_48_metabat_135_sub]